MAKHGKKKLESIVSSLRQSRRQGQASLPAAKRRALVRDFGSDAVRALLIAEHPSWDSEVFEFGQHSECPWTYPGLRPADIARRSLGPLAERLPRLRAKLASAELVVPVHHPGESDAPDLGGWFLIYAIPAEDGPQLWIAGPPEPEPELPAELDVAGWKLPEPLRELYAQHHGLGVLCEELGWTDVDPGVRPAVRLAIPTTESDGSWEPGDSLRFTRSLAGAGGSPWCLVRNFPRKPAGELAICQLDEARGQLGSPSPFDFWGFLDRYLTDDD
jgi:hypothetical protein